jgi:hypothetical protein
MACSFGKPGRGGFPFLPPASTMIINRKAHATKPVYRPLMPGLVWRWYLPGEWAKLPKLKINAQGQQKPKSQRVFFAPFNLCIFALKSWTWFNNVVFIFIRLQQI